MKLILAPLFPLGSLLFCTSSMAQNSMERTPMTMDQLMSELRIQGGNFQFSFERPVFARVTTEVTDDLKPEKTETLHFVTATANRSISLFFSASGLFVGDYQKPNETYPRKMLVKLSDCEATDGTRVIHYMDRLTGNHSQYSPAIPAVPQVGKPYVLHWYFKAGDPYYAKAVIEFSESSFPR